MWDRFSSTKDWIISDILIFNFFLIFRDLGDGAITALVNKYADKLFKNIETYAVGHGLDPVLLADFNQKVTNLKRLSIITQTKLYF